MHVLSSEQDLQSISGGFGTYDVGHNLGAFADGALGVFIAMGLAYGGGTF